MNNEYGAIAVMRIGKENRSTGIKPNTIPLLPQQTPHNLTWD
jgi:hypothetical protein